MRVRLATALLVVLGACGRSEPSHRGRTVAHWVGALGGEPAAAAEAQAALVDAAAKDPEPVLRELERALRSEPAPVEPTTFVLALDPEAAAREGLPPMPAEEAVHLDLGPVRNRAAALGEPVNLRGRREGFVEVTARSRPPEDLQRLQRALTARGALEIVPVAHDDPKTPGLRYDGPTPLADLRAQEAARFAAARAEGKRYEPSDPRWRVAPRVGTAATEPGHFEVLGAETGPEGPFTEEAFSSAAATTDAATKEPAVLLTVHPTRRAHLRALTTRHLGGPLAVLLDGAVVEVVRAPFPLDERMLLPVPRTLGLDARELAAVLAGGRVPRPLRVAPSPPGAAAAPSTRSDTPVARALAALGPAAVPTLERVRDGDAPAHVKAQAVWALARIRGSNP